MIRLGLAISFVCFLITVTFSAIGWYSVPEGQLVVTQVGPNGQPTNYGSKAEAFLFLPAILAGITFLLSIAPAIDPRGQNIRRSRSLYMAAWVIGMVAIMAGQGMVTWLALGNDIPEAAFSRGLSLFLPVLMIVLGLFIAKARPNFFAGFRTPWTLSSDLSWDKTHRWASRLFLIVGLSGLIAAFLVPGQIMMIAMFAALMTVTLGLVIYSWWVWKNDPARETLTPEDADTD
ncbi:SdpI family protein [Hyphobacterium sp.]|uniref:SdpI family protein n=1 Tax=Hyphobacterium sp. TaxID=2004662 RepID=UPI003BAC0014